MADAEQGVVEIVDLSVSYRTEEGDLPAVRAVTLDIARGETLGLVGESGSGKTTLALGAVGYLPANGRITSGSVRIAGESILGLDRRRVRR
jgi:peptide/nickel transport system ATP-binding protein